MANYNGTAGDDALFGDAGNDTIDGGIGDDLVLGGTDSDRLLGSDGNDVIAGNDLTIQNGIGLPIVDTSQDTLNGGDGDDYLLGGASDIFIGGNGTDAVHGASAQPPLIAPGASGADTQSIGAGDTVGDTIATATALGIDASIVSAIDTPGDHDVFSITLTAGQTYTFALEQTDWDSGIDSYLQLRDGSGAVLVTDDDDGIFLNSQITFTAASTGTYYLDASGTEGTTGSYVVSTNTLDVGGTSPTYFSPNGKPLFSWEQTAFQIAGQFEHETDSTWLWPGDQASWSPHYHEAAIVTYAFRGVAPADMPEDTAGFSRFNNTQIAMAIAALNAWASVANIQFVRVDDGDGYANNAQILFGNYNSGESGAAAFAYTPVSNEHLDANEGDVWVNNSLTYNSNPAIGNYGAQALLHEIGHAIGLNHPGAYNAAPGVVITYNNSAEYYQDSRMFTVMSYFDQSSTGGNLAFYASLPQLYDIDAIQQLYGANTATRAGDTVYGFGSNTGVAQFSLTSASQGAVFAIWDGGGNDTLNLSGYSSNSIIDLREEAFSSAGPGSPGLAHFNISIARGAVIENGIGGSGNDSITGNAAANTLTGNGGDDTLDGGSGADTLTGGAGNDYYLVDNAADTIVESAGGGADQVIASVSWTLSDTLENLQLSGNAAINATGNSGGNTLGGNDQNNILDGMGGIDSMWAGGGDDTIIVDNASDFAVGGDGYDIVKAYVSWSVNGGGVEEIQLLGSALNATGSGDNERLVGNELANRLDGSVGNDTLVGGLGNDTLLGNVGDDTIVYAVGDGVDSIDGGTGTDTLAFSSTSGDDLLVLGWNGVSLTGFVSSLISIEVINADLSLGTDTLAYSGTVGVTIDLGAGSASGISTLLNVENATGDDGNDMIAGSAAANQLDGGIGNDALSGGGGGDTLFGRAGADTLDGGSGADTLYGGDGADVYVVDNAGDVIIDTGAMGGVDTVQASIGWTLTADFENLVLIGASAINGTGNALANVLSGNAFANVLDGGAGDDAINAGSGADTLYGRAGGDTLDGGAGADTMYGGDGDDVYVVDNASDATIDNGPLGGADTVQTSIGWTLTTGIEALVLMGNNAINGAGNELANQLYGNNAANVLSGNAGADYISASDGADTLNGGDGGDVLFGEGGNDFIDGGADDDYASADTGLDVLYGRTGSDQLYGDAGADTVFGGDGADHLYGGDDLDLLDGGADDDTIEGEAGGDTLYGRAGGDILDGGAGADTMFGGDGDDYYYVDNAGDVVGESAGAGTDNIYSAVSYSLGQYQENLTLTGTLAFVGVGNILSNEMNGNDENNTLSGLAGADFLFGFGGSDKLNGGDGNDWLVGGSADDTLDGGNDSDLLEGRDGADTLYGRTGNDTLYGDDGNDTLYGGDGDDTLRGFNDADLLDGNNGNDSMFGGNGDDTLYGRQNADTLNGDAGNDTLFGGDGNDTIAGGAGNDTESGGNGDDTFVFSPGSGAADTISDFVAGGVEDTLDLSAFNGSGVTWSVSQAGADTLFTFSNGDALTLSNVNMNDLVAIDTWHYG